MIRRVQLSCLAVTTVVSLLAFGLVFAESAPLLHNFQGRLTNSVGTPVTSSQLVTFRLIEGGTASETPTTGTVVYEEQQTITPNDTGVFVHVIGSGTPLNSTVLEEADFVTSGLPLFVELELGGETLLPRTQVLSVGYAIEASRLNGMSSQEIIGQAGGNAFANAVVRSGAELSRLTVSQIRVRPGTLGFSDGKVRRTGTELTWDFATGVGPLGLDSGVEAADTWYFMYAMPDPIDDTQFTVVASTSTPLHVGGLGPSGFAVHRYLGSFFNWSTSDIFIFRQGGNRARYIGQWQIYSHGGIPFPTSFQEIDLSLALPATASSVEFSLLYIESADEAACLYNEAQRGAVWLGRSVDGTGNIAHANVVEYPINPTDRRVHIKECGGATPGSSWLQLAIMSYSELLD